MTGKFEGCIGDALAAAEDADAEEKAALREAEGTYHEAYAAAAETLSPDEADRQASRVVMDELQAKALRARQLRALSVRSRLRILGVAAELKRARGYTDVADLGAGGKPPKDGWVQGGTPPKDGPGSRGAILARSLELLVENKPGRAARPDASLAGRARAVRGQFDAMMAEVIERFETRTGLDAPNRATLSNLVDEGFGEATGDVAAQQLAKAWSETAERARQMFNAAGGDIAKRDGWGFPQHWDPITVRKLGKPAFLDGIGPLLDRAKMTDRVTGLPFTDKRLRAVLSEVYDSIASGGASKRTPGEGLGTGLLANTRKEERFLVFRDAASWKAAQAKFGTGDPFGIMMGHLDEMAHDIAQLQLLGPNPAHQFAWLKKVALHEAALEQGAGVEGAVDNAASYVRTAQEMLDHFTGSANVPERAWLARVGATGRALLTPAALGSAILTDAPCAPVFGAFARTLTGLSKLGQADRFVALLADPAARAMARRAGFILESATEGLARGAQDSLRLMTVGRTTDGRALNALARRLPAAVFRLSLLTPWTQARKRVFRLEFLGALADRAGQSLGDLAASGDGEDRAFGETLQGYGFTPADWDKMRTAPQWKPPGGGGAAFLRPAEVIAHAGEDLGLRMAEMVETQARQIIPEMTLWTRAKLVGDLRPGTWKGEFMRSWAMFRSFTLTAQHLYAEDLFLRGQGGKGAATGAIAAGAGLVGALTLAGATSIQLRHIVKGEDPIPMDSAAFWGAALLQGGGLGILGDLLFSAQTRAGKSSAMTGWGPVGAFGSDVWDATGGNVGDVAAGMHRGEDFATAFDKAHPGRDATLLLRRYNPLASLWWARTALDRAVLDQLQTMIDPQAQQSFHDRASRLQHDYGTQQWWPSGAMLPSRAPNLANAAAPSAHR